MRHRAFTLLEMTLSIVILFIVLALFSEFTQGINRKSTYFASKKELSKQRVVLYETIFYDFYLADSVSVVSNPTFDVVFLSTKNSMQNIAKPAVVWYVLKDGGKLVRAESPQKIKAPFLPQDLPQVHIDLFAEKITLFKAIKHKNLERYAISIEGENIKLFLPIAK